MFVKIMKGGNSDVFIKLDVEIETFRMLAFFEFSSCIK